MEPAEGLMASLQKRRPLVALWIGVGAVLEPADGLGADLRADTPNLRSLVTMVRSQA